MSQLNVASLLLVLVIGELTQPLWGHPQEVNQLLVVGVFVEDLHETLNEPGKSQI